MEKPKREVTVVRRDTTGISVPVRTLAIVFIAAGVVLLLINMGLFSWNSIGDFFGDIGRFFGNLGGDIGRFFGTLGSEIGRIFGSLGRSLADLWPLALIAAGLFLLLRRGKRSDQDNPTTRDS